MIHNLSETNSIASQFVAEIRDENIQGDRLRFRRNLERLGEILAYEISKKIPYQAHSVKTSLGKAACQLPSQQPVLATILRAGLPLHQGLLNYFDKADCAYISAYRKHRSDGTFDICLQYVSCPDLSNRILIISDPMLATGSSMVATLEELYRISKPSQTHIVSAIACKPGIELVRKHLPEAQIWVGAIDPELNSKAYIIPGLGDAGDLAFGPKIQN
jgi:uracil phosphoribosyltransferase